MNSFIIARQFVKRAIGNKKTLIMSFLLPAILIAFIMNQINLSTLSNEPVAYVNLDKGALSGQLVDELSQTFRLIEAASEDEVREEVIKQTKTVGIVIPNSFSDTVLAGGKPQIAAYQLSMKEMSISLQLAIDNQMRLLTGFVQSAREAGLSVEALQPAVAQLMTQQSKHQISASVTDYGLHVQTSFRIAMGFLLMFMLIAVTNGVSIMLEDRQRHTMTRIYSAPVRAYEIALGNYLGSLAVGTLQLGFVLAIIHFVVGLDYKISFLPHFMIAELFLMAAIGIGTAIGALIKDASHLSSLNTLVITPTCMLGGCFWPIWLMEDYMQKISYFVPQRWALDAMEKLAGGADLSQVALHLGVLALFALVLFGIGSAVLRPAERESA